LNAQALAQALQGVGASGAQHHQHQHQQQQHARPRRADKKKEKSGSGVPVQHPTAAGLPLDPNEWWQEATNVGGEVDDASAVDAPDPATACAVLSEVLGVAVAAPGVPSAPGTVGAIQIVLVRGGITDKVLDATVRSRLSPGRLKGKSMCVELAACHTRAVAMQQAANQEATGGEADQSDAATLSLRAAVSGRCRAKLAKHMLSQLEDDGDDLYFEGGRHRGDFLRAMGAGGQVSSFLLEDMLDATKTDKAARSWDELLRRGFAALSEVPLDAVEGLDEPSRALELLTRSPRLLRALAAALTREVSKSSTLLGARAAESKGEAGAVLGPALGRGALPQLSPGRATALLSTHGAPAVFTQLKRYPRCPAGDRKKLQWIVQRGAKTTHDVVHGVLFKVVKQKGHNMEAVLAWLAAATSANERREATVTHHSGAFGDPAAPTDNFLVGVAAVALRFARPVVDDADRLIGQRLMDLVPLRRNWRHDWAAEESLAGRAAGAQVSGKALDGDATAGGERERAGSQAAAAPAFVAETFYAAMRAMQVGLLPAVRRFEEVMQVLQQRARAKAAVAAGGEGEGGGGGGGENGGGGGGGGGNPLATDEHYNAYFDCAAAALLDPELAGDASRFALLQAAWLTQLARLPEDQAREAFGLLPESCVKCMAEWVCFVLRMGKAELLLDGGSRSARPDTAGSSRPSTAGPSGSGGGSMNLNATFPGPSAPTAPPAGSLPVGVLVRCATELLSRPSLVRHPTVHAALVEMLQHMLLGERRGGGASLGVRGSSTHELLVSSVLGSPEAKASLCPALIRAYSVMDAVVGLDVDRDKFDKFHTRDVIARLLEVGLYTRLGLGCRV
jgi:hypothetical protein